MTIELRNFSSKTSATHPRVQSVKGFSTKLLLRIFLNSEIYETFPIRNFLRIRYHPRPRSSVESKVKKQKSSKSKVNHDFLKSQMILSEAASHDLDVTK